jgi:predicted metal-dependent hydrolase
MRIAVYCDGSVVLTMPSETHESVGEKFIIEKAQWLFSKLNFFSQFHGKPLTRFSREDYLKYKGDALAIVEKKIEDFNTIYHYHYSGINIKNQKTCWGSCSKKRNLNFNYKLLFLSSKIQDYIVVHELCHLKEFNHSKKFWALVAQAIPDYSNIKNELRNNGLGHF